VRQRYSELNLSEARPGLLHLVRFDMNFQTVGWEFTCLEEGSREVMRARPNRGYHGVQRRRSAVLSARHAPRLIKDERVSPELDAAGNSAH
jgi:epoxyqueuosine reductase QueG